ncbi:MAG: UPF0158 family protein [Planctomycetota bacterium]|nr:UPF0158 family protein [Planctomycetota bacterium]
MSDLVDGLEMVSASDLGESYAYLDKITGEVFHANDEELFAVNYHDLEDDHEETVEESGNLDPNWRDEENLEKRFASFLKAIVADDGNEFICLPDSFDIDDYSIMEDFCHSIENEKLRESMLNAIKGRGAFARFREHLRKHDIEKDWFAFERKAYQKIITDWCKLEKIEYIDDLKEE